MTERLYYNDSFLYEFDARVTDVIAASPAEPRPAVVLDRTAFYPTSGGQVFDTGILAPAAIVGQPRVPKVVEVFEREAQRRPRCELTLAPARTLLGAEVIAAYAGQA